MKMKSVKKKSLLNKAKRGERQHGLVIVKTENQSELNGEVEEGSSEVYSNGDGLNVQIKEEPHAQEICGEHNGDTSSCPDTKPDTVTLRSDVHHPQGHIKEECDSDHQPEYEFTGAAFKEESIKEERDCEEEAEDVGNMQEEEVCTGRNQFIKKHTICGYPIFAHIFFLCIK